MKNLVENFVIALAVLVGIPGFGLAKTGYLVRVF